jgi:hypothetical protein
MFNHTHLCFWHDYYLMQQLDEVFLEEIYSCNGNKDMISVSDDLEAKI